MIHGCFAEVADQYLENLHNVQNGFPFLSENEDRENRKISTLIYMIKLDMLFT